MQQPKTPNKRKLATVPFRTAPDSKTVQTAAMHLGVEPGDVENALTERTPLSKVKPSDSPLVMLPVEAEPDSEEFQDAAKKLGIAPDDLVKVIGFQEALRREANRLKLSPPHIVSGCLNLVGDLLAEFVNEEHKADMVTSIFRQLWAHAGLASDHAEGSVKIAPPFTHKGEKY